jgi:signal transduction histidine kinase
VAAIAESVQPARSKPLLHNATRHPDPELRIRTFPYFVARPHLDKGSAMSTQAGRSGSSGRLSAIKGGRYERCTRDDEDVVERDDQLAHVIHDLKNPLSTIALEIELMSSRLSGACGHELAPAIGRIRRNVRFLDRLVYELMDACTLANGRFALRRSPCELGTLVAETVERTVPSAERHRVTLEVGERVDVMADALRIERVVANLLGNALKYTPPSSGILIRMRADTDTVQVSVCDSGPGLSLEEIELLFQPYRRVASSRARPGTGLGLYVSKRIVEAHGGTIGVESLRGMGARFHFALPLR